MIEPKIDFIVGWKVKEDFDCGKIKYNNNFYDIYELFKELREFYEFNNKHILDYKVSFCDDINSPYIVGMTWRNCRFEYGLKTYPFDINKIKKEFEEMKKIIEKHKIYKLLSKIFPLEGELQVYMVVSMG